MNAGVAQWVERQPSKLNVAGSSPVSRSMVPICWRVARRYLAEISGGAKAFADDFFKRHPALHKFAPKKVLDKSSGGGGADPEARQQGGDIFLFPKFWHLDAKTRDFVFAHEIGHYVLSAYGGLAKLIENLTKRGVDPWDASSLPFGQHNVDEAFADSFASHFMTPGELNHRYPQWDAVLHDVIS